MKVNYIGQGEFSVIMKNINADNNVTSFYR